MGWLEALLARTPGDKGWPVDSPGRGWLFGRRFGRFWREMRSTFEDMARRWIAEMSEKRRGDMTEKDETLLHELAMIHIERDMREAIRVGGWEHKTVLGAASKSFVRVIDMVST